VIAEFAPPDDRFVVEARVGSGGMGDVFKALDQQTGQTVALKLLRSTATPHERARFVREIEVIADLRHPNIVQYIAHGTWHDGRVYFAMEWLDGEDLSQRQRRAPLGLRDAVEVVRRSAAAMAAVHARGVVHRDLKLSNIFLVRGKGTAVKLIDFGVVKPPVPDEYPTERGTIIGTPHFMAPEQARGELVDARADVYSLGAVLFRLVTGRNVFQTDHIIALLGRLVLEDPPAASSFRFDVPEALDQVLVASLARDPAHRFENGGDLARALARVGTLDNDPPATDRSASAIRKHNPNFPPATLSDSGSESKPLRPSLSERRVVACVLFEIGAARVAPEVESAVRDALGEDARLERIMGDRIVGVLGVERSRGDEAMRAARAALTLTNAIPTARAALAVGRVVRGRNDLTGDALERAAQQLEQSTPGVVRLDMRAAAAIEGRFVVHEDPNPTTGGVLMREDATGFGARQLLGRVTPTVGREKEIALLQGIFGDLLEEATPRAAIVTGAAGIGKSRVRSELMQRLEVATTPPEAMICRGDPMSRSTSLSALGRALRARMGVHDGEALEAQIQKVKVYVGARLPRTLRFLSAFIGELIGVNFPDDADAPLRAARSSAQLMQSRLRMALEAFVRAQSDMLPQVLVIEDAHWADDTTLDLVDWLLGCANLRFAVFAFGRPELLTRVSTLWERRTSTRLALPPLSPTAAERLVATVLPALDGRARSALVQRADGNALFLEELVRCAAEGRDELPLTVQAIIQLRLDRMSPNVREVVRAASVFGQSFWTGGVSALIGRDVEFELNELFASELVSRQDQSRIAGQDEWIFRQALVRDVAYASLLDDDRPQLHLAAGNWLESIGDVDAGLLARHLDEGGDRARAAHLYARATRQAFLQGGWLETALDLADRGIACGAEGDLRAALFVSKAQVLNFMGRLLDGVAAADEATKLAVPGSDLWGEAHRLAAAALIEAGRSAEGDARADWALASEHGATLTSPIRATLLAVRVRGLVDIGRSMEAVTVANQALAAAKTSGVLDSVLRALDARLFVNMNVADPGEAIETGERLIEAAEAAGDVVLASRARINSCAAFNQVGMYEVSQATLERAIIDVRARRLRILEGFAFHNLGMSVARLGRIDEGIELQRAAARISDETNAARLRIHSRTYEANLLLWRGTAEDVNVAYGLARWMIEATESHPKLKMDALFTLARAQLARGTVEAALENAREAATVLTQGPVEEWEDMVRLVLIQALLASGEEEEANHVIADAFRAISGRAAKLRRPEHRQAMLTRAGELVQLLELANTRLGMKMG